MAHSLRKVFSREDKDWQESIALSRRVRSEVLPSGGYANHGNGKDYDNDDDNRHRFRGHVEESIETAATITTSFDNKEDSSSSSSSPAAPADRSRTSSSTPQKPASSSPSPSSSTSFASPMTFTRAKSTNYSHRKNHPRVDESPTLAYALRKVFSRDHPENDPSSEWTAREAKGLLVPRVSSRVAEEVPFSRNEDVDGGIVAGETEGEGAELVLESFRFGREEVYYDDDDEEEEEGEEEESNRNPSGTASNAASSTSKKISPIEFMNRPATKESGGYGLKRIFSYSNNNNRGANGDSPLFSDIEGYEVRNTKMDDAMNTHEEDSDDPGTATDAMAVSSASIFGRLSKPISLIRNAKSTPHYVGRFTRTSDHANAPATATSPKGNKLGKNHDDDVSTIAESIDTSSASPSHNPHRSGRHSRRHAEGDWNGFVPMKTHWKRALIMLVVIGLCAIGIGVFLGTQKSSSNNRSNGSNGGTIQVQSTTDGNSNDMDIIFGNDDDETVSNGDDNNNTILPPSDQFPNPTTFTPTESPISLPTNTPTLSPSTTPSTPPSTAPTSRPTHRPTQPPTDSPTTSPTLDTTTVFYVIADAPYSDDERENIMPRQIDTLGKDAEFLVHVGDLEYAIEDRCEEWAYEIASDILNRSQVPVFVLPGDNDINDCDDIEHGEYMWRKYFRKFDQRWDHDFELTRWGNLDESFSFLHNGVLFFGINIVGGTPYSKSEAQTRHAVHLSKLKNIMKDRYHEYELVILFGHAEPASWHDDLFLGSNGLATFVEDMGKPFLHLHGDWHEWYEVESSFDVDNYLRISLDAGEFAPPIRVMIDSSKKNPVRISRRASDLDVECCSHGWPRLSDDDYDDDDDWDDDGWDDDGR